MLISLRKSNKRPEMEFLIPSLALLLAAVAFAFFIMPKFAPVTLIMTSAAVLAVAIYMHWSQFGVAEYERATWYYKLKDYGSYIMVGVVLLGAYGFYAMNNWGGESSLPSITTPTVGGGMGAIAKTVSSRIDQLMRKGRISVD